VPAIAYSQISRSPLALLTVQQWANINSPYLGNTVPTGIYLDRSVVVGTNFGSPYSASRISVWGIPDTAYGVELFYWYALTVGNLNDNVNAPPGYFRLLPDDIAAQLLTGLLGADRTGFLSPRWARAFAACCADVLGARVTGLDDDGPDGRLQVEHGGRTTAVDVHPLGVDGPGLQARAAQADVQARLAVLREQVGPRQALVRVDRTELSKNIVRGLQAYRELLHRYPQWRGEVVHLAFAYPSRHDLA
jgi:hypothetical protein